MLSTNIDQREVSELLSRDNQTPPAAVPDFDKSQAGLDFVSLVLLLAMT